MRRLPLSALHTKGSSFSEKKRKDRNPIVQIGGRIWILGLVQIPVLPPSVSLFQVKIRHLKPTYLPNELQASLFLTMLLLHWIASHFWFSPTWGSALTFDLIKFSWFPLLDPSHTLRTLTDRHPPVVKTFLMIWDNILHFRTQGSQAWIWSLLPHKGD